MLLIWNSTRMGVPKLYRLIFNALYHPASIGLSTNKRQATSSFSSIRTLNLVYLNNVLFETLSNDDIVATIRFLEVLRDITAVVISLRASRTSSFLDFPNEDNAIFTFSMAFSHVCFVLASSKPKNFVAGFIFLCFINPWRI